MYQGNARYTINKCKTIFQDLCPKDRNTSYLKEMKRKFCKLGLEVRNFFDTCFVFLNLLFRLSYSKEHELNSIEKIYTSEYIKWHSIYDENSPVRL